MIRRIAIVFATLVCLTGARATTPNAPIPTGGGPATSYLVPGSKQPVAGSVTWPATAQPENVSGSPGHAYDAIAEWTDVQLQTFTTGPSAGQKNLCVLAFHSSGAFATPVRTEGITHVDFMADGGATLTVTEKTPVDGGNNGGNDEPAWCAPIDLTDTAHWKPGLHEIRAIAYPYYGAPRVLQSSRYVASYTQSNQGVFTSLGHGYNKYDQLQVVSMTHGSTSCLSTGLTYTVEPGLGARGGGGASPGAADFGQVFVLSPSGRHPYVDTTDCNDTNIILGHAGPMPYGDYPSQSDSLWIFINDGKTIWTPTVYVDGINGSDIPGCGSSGSPCKTIAPGALDVSMILTPAGFGRTFTASSDCFSYADGTGGYANGSAVAAKVSNSAGLIPRVPYWVNTSGCRTGFKLYLTPGSGTPTPAPSGKVALYPDVSTATICLVGSSGAPQLYSYGPVQANPTRWPSTAVETTEHLTIATLLTIKPCSLPVGSGKSWAVNTSDNTLSLNGTDGGFVTDDIVIAASDDAGLTAGYAYYVINHTPASIQLSATKGGRPLTLQTVFTASMDAGKMNVTSISSGSLWGGKTVTGANVPAGTRIGIQLTGKNVGTTGNWGGIGQYALNNSPLVGSEQMSISSSSVTLYYGAVGFNNTGAKYYVGDKHVNEDGGIFARQVHTSGVNICGLRNTANPICGIDAGNDGGTHQGCAETVVITGYCNNADNYLTAFWPRGITWYEGAHALGPSQWIWLDTPAAWLVNVTLQSYGVMAVGPNSINGVFKYNQGAFGNNGGTLVVHNYMQFFGQLAAAGASYSVSGQTDVGSNTVLTMTGPLPVGLETNDMNNFTTRGNIGWTALVNGVSRDGLPAGTGWGQTGVVTTGAKYTCESGYQGCLIACVDPIAANCTSGTPSALTLDGIASGTVTSLKIGNGLHDDYGHYGGGSGGSETNIIYYANTLTNTNDDSKGLYFEPVSNDAQIADIAIIDSWIHHYNAQGISFDGNESNVYARNMTFGSVEAKAGLTNIVFDNSPCTYVPWGGYPGVTFVNQPSGKRNLCPNTSVRAREKTSPKKGG